VLLEHFFGTKFRSSGESVIEIETNYIGITCKALLEDLIWDISLGSSFVEVLSMPEDLVIGITALT